MRKDNQSERLSWFLKSFTRRTVFENYDWIVHTSYAVRLILQFLDEGYMNIAFHGTNAANFRFEFETYLTGSHRISVLSEDLSKTGELSIFRNCDVIVGTALTKKHPIPVNARLYQVAGAGYDGIDFSRLPSGCLLCNCFGHEEAITEYVMAAILTRYVPLNEADVQLRKGDWYYNAGRSGGLRSECSGSSIGILGYGHIGKAIARRAKAFNMNVHVANRSRVLTDEYVDWYYPLSESENFYGSVDVLVVALPLTDTTTGLVDGKAFAAMRPDCLVVNVGRGQVIEEEALYDALKNNRIGSAVIDTWYVYPNETDSTPYPGRLPFHELENIIITPHMSGWTWGTISRRQQLMAENIHRLANGEKLLNVIMA